MTTQGRGPTHNPSTQMCDEAVFDRWVGLYTRELYGYAYRISGDRNIAEDLVQETFFEAWKHRGPLRGIREPRAWLFAILRRRVAKLRRYEKRRTLVGGVKFSGRLSSGRDESRMERAEDSDMLQRGLDTLDDLYKYPLLMVFVEGATCAEVAERLDLPLGTVLSRVHRAKNQLRGALGRIGMVAEGSGDRGSASGCAGRDQSDTPPALRIGGVQ